MFIYLLVTYLYLYIYISIILHMCVCMVEQMYGYKMYSGDYRGPNKALDALELELQAVVN